MLIISFILEIGVPLEPRETFQETTSPKTSALILKNVSLKIAGMLPDDEGPLVIWKWIKADNGPDDLYQIKREF
jgi:hypothetical protein